MTEDQARAALAAFDGLGGLERWIAAQRPWEATPGGWTGPGARSTRKRHPWSGSGTTQPPGAASQGCSAIQRSSPPTAVEGGQRGAGLGLRHSSSPIPLSRASRISPTKKCLRQKATPVRAATRKKAAALPRLMTR